MALDGEMPTLQEPVGIPNEDGLAEASAVEPPIGVFIKPPQRKTKLEDKELTLKHLVKAYIDDLHGRTGWSEARLQRIAKYRGWREQKIYPWVDASNAHLPIIMTDVQRTNDTLHNAVLSVRPVMNAKATLSTHAEKESTIDKLLDHQVFVENHGEDRIGNLINSFTEDGQYIAYTPYIKEKQKITKTHTLDFPPTNKAWDGYLLDAIQTYYPTSTVLPDGKKAPWAWILKDQHPLTGEVETSYLTVFQDGDEPRVLLVCHKDDVIFDGPALIPKELEDIVVPARCENLQPQCMANPTGAPHVFMVEYPTKNEILKLIDNKFYDEVSNEDREKIKGAKVDPRVGSTTDPQTQKNLQDDLVGLDTPLVEPGEETFTRLTYFGHADLDGDGFDEEVVYWFLEKPQVLLRARYLSEVYPTSPLRRPFSMAKYIPVNGQFYAIGLIELMESCYDIIKKTFDQMIDSGDITNTPWGFYRPMSGIRPEKIRLGPGDLFPTNSPKDDVFYPQLPQGMTAFGHNLIALLMQILDQTTLVGQLQLGGVPQGKSAALRTTTNMQSLLQQGDARPERVLRRFFTGLSEIWQQFHELNQVFLPKKKLFRISTGVTDEKNPYVMIEDRSQIEGRFLFEFGASILNTNRSLATSAYQDMLGMLIHPLLLQMGISTPDKIFALLKDWIRARGQEPMKYISPPSNDPFAYGPVISVEDAIVSILNGDYPQGKAMEPLDQHLQKLQEFVQKPETINALTPSQTRMLGQYAAARMQEMMQLMEQQQMLANAAAFQQQQGQGQGGPQGQAAPPNTGPGGNAPVQKNELLDESLPGAGGGANGGKP